jgi:bis(5'-nucleosyl)-tetraphosphatase (symmetrical)
MPTYAIGDVQGCYDSLMKLLEIIQFDPANDQLWFVGDLINRGPASLKTLQLIHSFTPSPICVLGNHDLTLLAVARGAVPFNAKSHSFSDILEAEDKEELLSWLEQRPLIHYDARLNYALVHAGIYPKWDLDLALSLGKEVESVLKGPDPLLFYQQLYGNFPEHWDPDLQGYDRLRLIVNAFTRMRFCSIDGHLELYAKESANHPPTGFYPWFNIPTRPTKDLNIIFGHWASLEGKCNEPNVFAIDTGCVWGGALTALRLEDQRRFCVSGS